MENKRRKRDIIFTILLMILIIAIIIGSFIWSDKPFTITAGIVMCLALLVILCLADSFDNLSIPKLISLNRNVEKLKKENNKLEETNLKLLEQMVNIKNTNNQIMYMPGSLNTVGSSNIEDIKINKKEEIEKEEISNVNIPLNEDRKRQEDRYKYIRNLEVVLLKNAIAMDNNEAEIQYNVKITNNKSIEDNIMKNEIRFDALKTYGRNNTFYEVRVVPIFVNFNYQLHYMLKLIELYGEINKATSKLLLVIPKYDRELEEIIGNGKKFEYFKNKIYDKFEAAIESGLLEIKEVDISKSEIDEYISKKETDRR